LSLSITLSLSFLIPHRPPTSPLFPYTTLFRSKDDSGLNLVGWHACELPDYANDRNIDVREDVRGHAEDADCAEDRNLQGYHDEGDRKSTRLNSSHRTISYAVFCLKKKKKKRIT